MKPVRSFLLFAALAALAGCATPGRTYAGRHPELPAAHRQILLTGQVTGGDAIAGMTREEVTLALGAAARFDQVNGEDMWIYARKAPVGNTSPDFNNTPGSSFNRTASLGSPDAGPEAEIYTSIYFRGDRATHAVVSNQKP